MSDTAVLDAPATAEAPGSPPPAEPTQPDSKAQAAAPETEAPETTPETEQDDEFAGLTPAEIRERIKAATEAAEKSAEARARESERRRQENLAREASDRQAAENHRAAIGQARAIATGQAQRELLGVVMEAAKAFEALPDYGELEVTKVFPAQRAQAVINRMSAGLLASYAEQVQASAGKAIAEEFPELETLPKEAAAANGAFVKAAERGDIEGMVVAMIRATKAIAEPAARARLEKEQRERDSAAAETDEMRAKNEKARAADRPTAVGGTPRAGREPTTLLEAAQMAEQQGLDSRQKTAFLKRYQHLKF